MLKRNILILALTVLAFAQDTDANAEGLALGGSAAPSDAPSDGSVKATPEKAVTEPKARKLRAGTSGKRIVKATGAKSGMPNVARIEGKDTVRVVAMLGKRIIATTPVRHTRPELHGAALKNQSRLLRSGYYAGTKAAIDKAGAGVRFVLQALSGEKWVDTKPAAKA